MSRWFVQRELIHFHWHTCGPTATINKKIIRNCINYFTTDAKAVLIKTKQKQVLLFAFNESKGMSHQVLEVLKFFAVWVIAFLCSVHERQLQVIGDPWKKNMQLNAHWQRALIPPLPLKLHFKMNIRLFCDRADDLVRLNEQVQSTETKLHFVFAYYLNIIFSYIFLWDNTEHMTLSPLVTQVSRVGYSS